MIRSTLLSLFLLASFSLLAENEFTVTPSSGPTTSGTEVTVKGQFGNWPYTVLFDGAPAKSTVRVDAQTLVAVAPPHFPGPTRVVVFEYDIGIETGQTFTFLGTPEGYERILLPLLTLPVRGAFGSEFHTELRAYNASDQAISVTGLAPLCILSACPPAPSIVINPGAELEEIELSGTPGRFIYVPTEEARFLAFSLRVHDVTRAALNFGTEIPVVRERELSGDAITLLGVPTDPRSRNTLRIYGREQTFLFVTFSDNIETIRRTVVLQPGRDQFEPAYAMVGDFPVFASGASEMKVTIEPPPTLGPLPPVPVWAFVSVTNNETQVITTITPQR